jgi:5-oxopent-3-ene-1,2,5-tricarboxylate decarboxylase / 2-hydroxyhepta-2,4-diene-1,7-dioate isomerase
MRMQFLPKVLPKVLRGPRLERWRVERAGKIETLTRISENEFVNEAGERVDIRTARVLPPCVPSKIICVHLSYASRGIESRNDLMLTPTPTYFTKPPSALNAHDGIVVKPADCQYLNYEGEFAVVIGKPCKNVTPDEAWDYIEGFVPVLDMGLQDFRDTDQGSMLRVKGADGLLPIGAGIVRGVNILEQTLRTFVNGHMVQEAVIADELIWGPHYMIADIARTITLMPGDMILTGTPAHSRSVNPGDVVETEITNIGRVRCTIAAGEVPRAAALGVGHAPTDTPEVRRVALGTDARVREDLKANLASARSISPSPSGRGPG